MRLTGDLYFITTCNLLNMLFAAKTSQPIKTANQDRPKGGLANAMLALKNINVTTTTR
jgi:hypothetical protein